ncbi:aflatoxin B1 aldehyde reductase member 3 [Aspergillus udagawae]|nr:aflatoxin B1 aldehyde reductase member 3 [Aspergillus udagawae]GFG02203.1 aflatoxin B1 aldehyde reductase member 3 [Aspergillus udagawae]GFG20578.1 aflatoxin B1 aldehyde reductase member 3 [Aspergillus udagawae]
MTNSHAQIIFGAATFSIPEWSTPEKVEEFLQALERNNVKAIDTAQIYGASEELLGQTNAAKRFVIDTKVGGGFVPGSSLKDQVIKVCNESLQKLGTDSVNVYYIHAPDREVPLEETLAGINELYKAGKFKHFGLSNFRPDEVQEVVRVAKEKGYVLPSVYQGNYNAIARRNETELLPVLRENNIRFYAYSPIAGGFLTKTKEQLLTGGEGRWDPNTVFGQVYHKLYNKPALLEALDDWAEIAAAEGISKAELAYRWIFFHSHIRQDLGDAVIVGASKISQFEETVAAIQRGPLSAEAVKRIDADWEKIKDVAILDNFNA